VKRHAGVAYRGAGGHRCTRECNGWASVRRRGPCRKACEVSPHGLPVDLLGYDNTMCFLDTLLEKCGMGMVSPHGLPVHPHHHDTTLLFYAKEDRGTGMVSPHGLPMDLLDGDNTIHSLTDPRHGHGVPAWPACGPA